MCCLANKVNSQLLKFIMLDISSGISRRKLTADTQRGSNTTTISHSRESTTRREYSHWSNHEHHRDTRINTLLKLRKNKLEKITDQNYQILKRINQQKSEYTHKDVFKALSKEKENKELGPIGQWMGPTCFIIGQRGIMSEKGVLGDNQNIIQWHQAKSKHSRHKNSFQNVSKLQSFAPLRQRQLPDLYIMF